MKNDWQAISLGKLVTLERRPVKVNPDEEYAEIGIYSYGRGIFHKQPRSGVQVGDKDLFLIREGDFILQVTFAWEGAVGLASVREDGMYGSVRFPTFQVDESECYAPFLVNYFKTRQGREQLLKISPGSAGRNRVLSLKRIPEIVIPLPPLPEQQRIVARIEELARRVEEARGLRKTAMEEADALVDSHFKKILDEGGTNPNWIFGAIPMFAEVNPSSRSKLNIAANDLVSFVPMAAVDDMTGTIARPEARPFSEVAKGHTLFLKGDVIFARITPCMQNGKSAFAENLVNGVGCGSTEFHVLRPTSKVLGKWIHALVRHKDFKDDAAAHFKGTAGQQRVPESFLLQKLIPVPPLPEQHRIVAYLDNLQQKVDELRGLQAATQTELDALLPSILAKAFAGEL